MLITKKQKNGLCALVTLALLCLSVDARALCAADDDDDDTSTESTADTTIDFTASGNYRLYYSSGTYNYLTDPTGTADDSLTVNYSENDLSSNEDNPWGYYYYTEGSGTYTKFTMHDSSNITSVQGWYKSSSEYLYILDQGTVHMLSGSTSPAILFTAPDSAVYRVYCDVYSLEGHNSNTGRTLQFTSRFITSANATCDSTTYLQRHSYGHNNDGYGGFAPVAVDYLIYLKAGDKLTFEAGAQRNSSGATQIMNLYVCANKDSITPFTPADSTTFGVSYYNAYDVGDSTELVALINQADSLISAIGTNVGTSDGQSDGQYGADELDSLKTVVATAKALCATGTASQVDLDAMVITLQAAYDELVNSKEGYHICPNGSYSIRVNSSGRYLSQTYKPSSSPTYYYAGFYTYDELVAYATEKSEEVTSMNWTFNIAPVTTTDDDGNTTTSNNLTITTSEGYVGADAYVIVSEDGSYTFEFLVENKGDSLFAIRRSDGKYWTGSIAWSSPYNKVTTSDTPQYIFVLDSMSVRQAAGLSVTISSVGWATLYYGSYALDLPTGVSAYTVSVAESGSSTVANLTAVSDAIPAATAVLLQASAGTYDFIVSEGTVDAVTDNALLGTDEETTFSSSDTLYYQFSLSADDADVSTLGFYWQAEDGHSLKNAAHRGYLALASSGDSNEVKSIVISFGDEGDETTAIVATPADGETPQTGIYTLTGVRLNVDAESLPRGLYIINGKKTLIR